MNFHKDKSLNKNTTKVVNIWDKDIITKDFFLNLNDFSSQAHNNFYPFFSVERENFANQFNKEVLACLLNNGLIKAKFISKEAKEKAKLYLDIRGFNIGAYSDSRGIIALRKNLVNNFYVKRDINPKIKEDEIYLVNGSMNAYNLAINFIYNPGEIIILPSPCYKLFINCNTAFGLKNLFYNIDLKKFTIDVNLFIYN